MSTRENIRLIARAPLPVVLSVWWLNPRDKLTKFGKPLSSLLTAHTCIVFNIYNIIKETWNTRIFNI